MSIALIRWILVLPIVGLYLPLPANSACEFFRKAPVQTIDFCQTCTLRTSDQETLSKLKNALLSQTEIKIHIAGCLGHCSVPGVTFVVDGKYIPDVDVQRLIKLDLKNLVSELARIAGV